MVADRVNYMERFMGIIGKYALATVAAIAAFITLTGSEVRAQEKQTINAFSVWQATGQTFRTSVEEGTFVGVLRGLVFIETEQGPQRAGVMACPFTLTINIDTGEQEGRGLCTVTTNDGPMVFADVECRGFHQVGCKGDFTFSGGTERFSGITGGGPVTFRSDSWTVDSVGDFELASKAAGIAYWRDLAFKLRN
ncbi:MAG: hypothetical protein ACI9UK_002434 [Candidatus Krumholzibacteriia bacterium]|jgi:hypothetical protein